MEGFLKLSTAVNITVLMIDSSDHVTGKTGLSAGLTIYATKAAGTPGTITPTVTELDATNVKGVYKLALTTGHTDTLGEFQLHITASGADPTDIKWQVSTYLPGEAATLQTDQAVNVTKVNGTSQTARDIGASVLLDLTQALPSTPTANSTGEALFLADILGGRFGTAQAGAASTITLDSGASAVDGRYVGYSVYLYGGTGGGVRGVGQERTIVAYDGTTKVATVAQAWGTNPDNTSKFMLVVHPFANVGIWNGTVVATPATAGIPDVNAKNIGGTAQSAVDIAARLGAPVGASVSADVAAVKVDTAAVKVQTDKMAFTVTNQIDANVLDWKSATAPAMTGDAFARLGAPAGASVSADVAAVKTDTAAVKVQTDKLTFTVPNQVDSNVIDWKGATAPAMTGDAFARLGAPAGASVSADIAAVKAVDDAVKAKTDNLPSDPADASDIASAFGTVNGTLGTIAGYIDTEVGSIKGVTDKLNTALELDGSEYRFTTNALEQAPTGGSAPTASAIADEVQTRTIAAVTTVGSVTGLTVSDVGAIKAKTDSLMFTVPGELDANVQSVNDTEVIGDGSLGNEWGPAP